MVADDLGYSDLGCYGSEIETPNLDALAESGLVATSFYVAPDGGPTQAMLLTGVEHHRVGMAQVRRWAASPGLDKPAYNQRLSERAVTLASALRAAGYHTIMAGRWELGEAPGHRPPKRGFERSFALHDGAASHWSDMRSAIPGRSLAHYTRDGQDVAELPADHFSTRAFTDFVIESIEARRGEDRPFFAYLSFQAPHAPLAVPEDWRERYAGRYDGGYDAIRGARLLRMKQSGLVREDVRPYPGLPTVPAWRDLPEAMQKTQARKMELYAAMVSNLDFHVGRLLDHLRGIGELDETPVVFLSDNGASPSDRGALGMQPNDRAFYVEQFPVVDPARWGGPETFLEVGPAWAQVSTVPFRLFKGTLAEGGIRSPLIVRGPGVRTTRGVFGLRRHEPSGALLHVTDLAPTILELAGVAPPARWQGREALLPQGRSLVPLLAGELTARKGPHDWLGFELGGDRALRRGAWKLLSLSRPFGPGEWLLYRIDLDPAELYDRSQQDPDELRTLRALWEDYARAHGVAIEPRDAVGAASDQKSSPMAR
jgi:arylsulfatase